MFAPSGSSYTNSGLESSYPLLSVEKGGALLSPYAPPQGLASPLVPSDSVSAPLSASLQSGLDRLDLSSTSSDQLAAASIPCPILPSGFSMWTQNASGSAKHVFANLSSNTTNALARNQPALPQKSLESLRDSQTRFPQLASMHRRMPCQFLHAQVPLSLPRGENEWSSSDEFTSQLFLTSAQDLQLAAVTTLYLEGKRVSCVVEPVTKLSSHNSVESVSRNTAVNARPCTPTSAADPRRVSNGSSLSFSPVSSSSHGLGSPRTPPEANNNTNVAASSTSLQHPWTYRAPLKSAFLAEFLRRDRPSDDNTAVDVSTSANSVAQRRLLAAATSKLTIVQEFVVPNQSFESKDTSFTLSNEAGNLPSLGSTVGDVVLVIAWDFDCDETLVGRPGTPTFSLLMAPNGASPMRLTTPLPSPLLKFDDKLADHIAVDPTVQAPTLLRKRGMSLNKANLMLSIPPPSMYLNAQGAPNSALLGGGQAQLTPLHSPSPMAWGTMHQRAMRTPLTPLPQQGENTLCQPPPLNSGDEARLQKERLERLWASKADGTVGPLHSPLEMTFGANATCMPTAASTSMAAAAANGRASPNPLGLIVPTASGFGVDGSLLSPAHF